MTTKTFVDYSDPVVDAAWLNDVDQTNYVTVPANTAAIAAHLVNTIDAHAASAITNTPAGNIAATTVQAAINELDTEKAAVAQVHYIGTTSIAANRASGAIALTGITSIDGNAATATLATNTTNVTGSGTISATTTGGTALTPTSLAQGTQGYTLVAAVASTSGTSIDFTGIPSWATKIYIMFSGVSTNGTSAMMIQTGDSGGVETTAYSGGAMNSVGTAVGTTNFTTGFGLTGVNAAAITYFGTATLTRQKTSNFNWTFSSVLGHVGQAGVSIGGGGKATSAALDRVRITTIAGTDTFDAGEISIAYE